MASPARAWSRCGHLELDDLVVLGDAVVRRRPGTDDLRRALTRAPRLVGRARLESALTLVRTRVDSPQETRTRLLLVRAGLPEPEVDLDAYADDLERYPHDLVARVAATLRERGMRW